MECESELSFIQQQGIEVRLRGTTRDRTGPAYSRPGSAWLGDVEREVRVYTLGVSDPMLRRFKIDISIFPYFEPSPQYPPQGSRIANLFGLFDSTCWPWVFLAYLVIFYTFKLLTYITERMGYTSQEIELPFLPFR